MDRAHPVCARGFEEGASLAISRLAGKTGWKSMLQRENFQTKAPHRSAGLDETQP
jgi:hypothetical protein